MRKNTFAVFTAWNQRVGKGVFGDSISTDGHTIFSYKTPILERVGHRVVLNENKYSATTTRQQNDIRYLINENLAKFAGI